MSNTVVNRKVTLILYDLHRLLALFVTLFQTARTLYLLCAIAGYSKRGAYSWHGDTSTLGNFAREGITLWKCFLNKNSVEMKHVLPFNSFSKGRGMCRATDWLYFLLLLLLPVLLLPL